MPEASLAQCVLWSGDQHGQVYALTGIPSTEQLVRHILCLTMNPILSG
jgi:hypothetical protein